jgi:hypothetical protein
LYTGDVSVVQINDAKLIPPGSGLVGNLHGTSKQLDIFYNGPPESAQYLDVFSAPTFDYNHYEGS